MMSDEYLVFTIQCDVQRLKNLFRKREDIEAIMKYCGLFQNCSSLTLYNAFKFFVPHVETFIPSLKDENMTKKDQLNDPVIKIYARLTQSQIEIINSCLQLMQKHLSGCLNHDYDFTYQILNIVFSFVIDRQNEFCNFLESKGPSNVDPPKKTDMECPICLDLAETTYCDTVICLKCKFFFQGVMRGRILFSLRCSKFGNCSTKNDITCQKCRFDRCRLANMVDKYCYTELTELVSRSCLVCQRVDGGNKVVLGYYFCLECGQLLDKVLKADKEPVCFKEPEARCAANECPKCFKDKLYEYGMVDSYRMKFTGSKSVDQCYSLNKCCVCFNLVNQTIQWMDLIVCTECRAFLKTSLDQDNYILYCCPNGEAGCLCPCSNTKFDKKCPYCWFLRLELEGIVERWQICNANPSKWRDIQKGIDCLISDSNESDSDQDDGNDEEEEHQEKVA